MSTPQADRPRSIRADASRPDVAVVGAGPAGLGAAIACALRGLRVRVVERRNSTPIDKACGEGLMPDAVRQLDSWGVEPQGAAFVGIRYSDGSSDVVGRFGETHAGLGVRRTELSRAMKARAQALGVEVVHGETAHLVAAAAPQQFELEVGGERWRPKVVVGADGLRSAVRNDAGLAKAPSESASRRVGIRRHFESVQVRQGLQSAPTAGAGVRREALVEVFWGEGIEAYVTPIGAGRFGLAFLFDRRFAHRADAAEEAPVFERALQQFPQLAQRLEGCRPLGPVRGAGPLRCVARGAVRGNVALVGDAGGYVDAITGEGMAIAFAEGEALAECLARTSRSSDLATNPRAALRAFVRASRRHRRLPDALTRAALLASRRPWLRRRFLGAMTKRPECFDRILAVHIRAVRGTAALQVGAQTLWSLALASGRVRYDESRKEIVRGEG